MTVLIKAVDGGNTYYVKDGGDTIVSSVSGGENTYLPHVDTLDALSYEISGTAGGQVKMNFGGFTLLPNFASAPHPRFMEVTIYNQFLEQDGTITSEVELFQATVKASDVGPQNTRYDIYDKVYDVKLLDDAPDLGGVTNRVYPLAIGLVNLVQPLQESTDYVYHKAGIAETTPGSGDYHIYDNEVEKTVTIDDQGTTFQSILVEVWINGTTIESGISAGDLVTVAGTGTPTDYAGLYIVTDTRLNGVRIRLRVGQGYDGYTSGNTLNAVSITSVDSIEGKPKGTILMSGTGADTTLTDFFAWAKDRINTELGASYSLDFGSAVSYNISGFETEQQDLIPFMSKVAEETNHLFYIDNLNEIIHLVDMQTDNGTLTVDEYGYFSGQYRYQEPVKNIIFNWTDKLITTDDQGYPILEDNNQSQKVVLDSEVGKEDFKCDVYHRVIANIETLLIACGTSLQAPVTTVILPFQTGIVPGLKVTTSSDSKIPGGESTGVSVRIRSIQYDFENAQLICTGHVV